MARIVILASILAPIGALHAQSAQAGGPGRTSWTARVNAEIRASEYRFSNVAGEERVWSAPNRSQGLRSRISAAGLEVFPREASADAAGAPWKLGLSTRSFGREGFVHELPVGTASAAGARARIEHGTLTEWFENRPDGIEHGWDLESAPPGAEPLWIGLALEGALSWRIESDARSAVLVDACGEVQLRYRGLVVRDATGRELAARLRPSPEGLGISIDDRGARYPLEVDPLLTGPAWIAAGGQSSARFGISVSTAGDVDADGFGDVIVGADGYDGGQSDEGRAFVYLGSAAGLATSPVWTAESNQAAAGFGMVVSTAGDLNGDGFGDVVVGAPFYDGGHTDEGRVYVYLGSASGPAAAPAWTTEVNQQGARLGVSASSAGDVNGDGFGDLIVGAPFANGSIFTGYRGVVQVFHGSSSGLPASPAWTQQSDQFANLGGIVEPFNLFRSPGAAAAGDVNGDGFGDVIVAAGNYDDGETDEGRALVYHGSASGLSATPAWTAESDQAHAHLGVVAPAGDVNGDGFADVLVGAPDYDDGQSQEGRVYLFLGSASGLDASPAWVDESDSSSSRYGTCLAPAGDVDGDGYDDVILGAREIDSGDGAAFLYRGSASGLSAVADWSASAGQASASFGVSASTAGDVDGDGYGDVIVGADLYSGAEIDEGAAFVFRGSAGGLAEEAAWSANGDQADARFGTSVASAGDVNGDGFGDVVVGAPRFDAGESDEGRAFVFHGSADGLETSAAWTGESDQAGARFGSSVAGAGDVDGDGHDDVVVGAYGYDGGESDEGRAYLFLGASTGLSALPGWTAEADQAGAWLGWSVAAAGDVNGDGFGDVVVGAPEFDAGESTEGRALLYAGSLAGLSATAAWSGESNSAGARFGWSVSSAGDVDGDGFSDVIVGAPYHANGELDEGRASVYHGSATGLETSAAWSVEPDVAQRFLGWSVAAAGDVNGDGFGDVVLGDVALLDFSRAYVHHGAPGGLSTSPSWTVQADQLGSHFGESVAGAGDVNGDGYADVLVGASLHADEGRVFLYPGSASGLAASASWIAAPGAGGALSYFGGSVAAAGDVDGDGYGDVIVGAYRHDDGEMDEGAATVHHGNDGGGPTSRPRQRRVDGTPMALLDRSDQPIAFRLSAEFARDLAGLAWAGAGPTSARLQWEVVPLGGTFDGVPDGESAAQAVTGTPLLFDELVSGLEPNRPSIWRARIATDHPLFPNTPWFTLQAKAGSETKFRTARLPVEQKGRPATSPSGSVTRTVP